MKKISVGKIAIANADEILKEHLNSLLSVREWAFVMGYKELSAFTRAYRSHFGKPPKKSMVKIRINTAIRLLESRPDLSCYEIARLVGKRDEKALNNYFRLHIGTAPSTFRWDKNKGQKPGTKT